MVRFVTLDIKVPRAPTKERNAIVRNIELGLFLYEYKLRSDMTKSIVRYKLTTASKMMSGNIALDFMPIMQMPLPFK